ncbi:MAG: hypothetical protein KGI75_27265 [Rhizobiaceae bacterium]|nr:hypothetical protein [Rhizobiaceae bacterium]
MKAMILSVALVVLASPAFAIQTLVSTASSCQTIQSTIQRNRAVLLRYTERSGTPIYDRAVADNAQCTGGGFAQRTTFPAADNRACPVLICAPTDLRP